MGTNMSLIKATLSIYIHCLLCVFVGAKAQSGVFRTADAQLTNGQYITSFAFHDYDPSHEAVCDTCWPANTWVNAGGEAEIMYRLNTTGAGLPTLYLILDEDWSEARDAEKCGQKLEKARISHGLTNMSGTVRPAVFARPRIWHLIYADSYTCTLQTTDAVPNFIQYTLLLFNPDSIGNPRNHFSDEETGLFRFYQLLTLGYFVLGCIYGPRLYEALSKEGPMNLVLQLLSAATGFQAVGALAMMLHLRGFSKNGIGSPWFELLSEFLDVVSQFVMLYMLLSLSLGWTLSGTVKPARSFRKLREKPAAKIVAIIGTVQAVLFIWEQYEEREHRMYHAHRSYAGVLLVLVRIVLAALFAGHLYKTVRKERSRLKKDFYGSFTKCTMLWFLCYPTLVVCTRVFPAYLQYKLVTTLVVFCQSVAVMMLYQLFLSRSLYWEVSALSSTLPIRMDKSFSIKIYS